MPIFHFVQVEHPSNGGFTLKIRFQKNDPFGHGMTVPLPEVTRGGTRIGDIIRRFRDATASLTLEVAAADAQGKVCTIVRATRGDSVWHDNAFSGSDWNKTIRNTLLYLKLVEKNQLAPLSSHSFRKGGLTAAKRAGVPHDACIDVIGHMSTDAWLTYCKRPVSEVREFLANMD